VVPVNVVDAHNSQVVSVLLITNH